MIYDITPVPKPRMTQKDKRRKGKPMRPCVARYWAYVEEVRLKIKDVDLETSRVIFWMPMPKSWSDKKKNEMLGERHRQIPDIDNLWKALADALYGNDAHISEIRAKKRWAEVPGIQIVDVS